MPLPLTTQLVESKVKHASFYKSTGKSEGKTPNLAMCPSSSISQVPDSVKSNSDFQNRERRNDSATYFLHGQQHNVEVLTGSFERRNALTLASDSDKGYSRSITKKEDHHDKNFHDAAVAKHVQLKNKEGCDNASVSISGMACAPFLREKVQIGTAHDD